MGGIDVGAIQGKREGDVANFRTVHPAADEAVEMGAENAAPEWSRHLAGGGRGVLLSGARVSFEV